MDDFLAADPRRNGGDHLELGGWWRAEEGCTYSAAWAPGSVWHRLSPTVSDHARISANVEHWRGADGLKLRDHEFESATPAT